MTDDAPFDFVLFGRSPFEDGAMTWHRLAGELAAGHPVSYVLDPRRRLLPRRTCPAELRQDGVLRVSPFELPLSRFALPRRLAGAALLRTLRRRGRGPGPRTAAIVFPRSPLALVRALRPAVTVYWATDDFLRRPSGETDPVFAAWEREAARLADLLVGSSRLIADRLAESHGRSAHAIPNGFAADLLRREPAAPRASGAPPVFGYAGTIDPDRLDLAAVAAAARARPDAAFVFAGPVVRPRDPRLAGLFALRNVRRLDPVPAERVAEVVEAFDVALLPYLDTPMNRACSPLKALEALALGKPVAVSPGIDDLAAFRPAVTFFRGGAEIAPALAAALSARADPGARAGFAAARTRTWPAQVGRFLDLLRTRPPR